MKVKRWEWKVNIQKMKIMASAPITLWQTCGETVADCSGLQNHCRCRLQPWNYKMLTPWKESYNQLGQHIKKQRHYFANKGPTNSQGYGFSSGHVWMWQLDYKESWAPKNWCFWTMVFKKTLENPSDCMLIKPVHPKWNQPWIFIGRISAEAKAPYFGHLMWRANTLEKTLMLGKTEGKRRRGDRGWDGWMVSLTMDMSLSKLQEIVKKKEA